MKNRKRGEKGYRLVGLYFFVFVSLLIFFLSDGRVSMTFDSFVRFVNCDLERRTTNESSTVNDCRVSTDGECWRTEKGRLG